jgi:hypothetical protein
MNKHFLKNSVKRWLQLTLVLFVIAGWFIIKHQLTPAPKTNRPYAVSSYFATVDL